jgi:PIN domain nuclease of toxin-antitoxin system
MDAVAYLDTHVAAWLYGMGAEALSANARRVIEEAAELRISPMVRLELQYLYETGRVTREALVVIDELQSRLGLKICESAFSSVVQEASKQNWTCDPFDRIIVAQAWLNNSPLITQDEAIHSHYAPAIW